MWTLHRTPRDVSKARRVVMQKDAAWRGIESPLAAPFRSEGTAAPAVSVRPPKGANCTHVEASQASFEYRTVIPVP